MKNTKQLTVTQAHSSNHSTDIAVSLPRLMDQKDLASYLGKSVAWCEKSRFLGEGPQWVKLGRHVRYRAEDVLAWIEKNVRTSTGREA